MGRYKTSVLTHLSSLLEFDHARDGGGESIPVGRLFLSHHFVSAETFPWPAAKKIPVGCRELMIRSDYSMKKLNMHIVRNRARSGAGIKRRKKI